MRRNTESGSEEDMEILQLRKDALISMIKSGEDGGPQEEGVEQEAPHDVKSDCGKARIKDLSSEWTQLDKVALQGSAVAQPVATTMAQVEDTPSQGQETENEGVTAGSIATIGIEETANSSIQPTGTPSSSADQSKVCPPSVVPVEEIQPTGPGSTATCTRISLSPKIAKAISSTPQPAVTNLPEVVSTAASNRAASKLTTSLRPTDAAGSQPSSCSGSRYSSPTHSPAPSPTPSSSGILSRASSVDAKVSSRTGSPQRKSSLSVKVGIN